MSSSEATASPGLDRAIGALLGLAAGDAVGTTLEFKPPGSFAPIHDMVGGGPFRLAPGEWTDDTSMALCPAESLLEVVAADRWRQPGLHPEVAAVAAGSWATRGLVEAEWPAGSAVRAE